MVTVRYSSNNSGGNWWLEDKDWKALEAAGWKVEWREGRRLDALATEASKDFPDLGSAIREFEQITNQDASDEGCNCCGAPHCFSTERESASGEVCLPYLFPGREIPSSLRKALEGGQ